MTNRNISVDSQFPQTKKILRKVAREIRNNISEADKQKHSLNIKTLLIESKVFASSQTVAVYWPHRNEVDTRSLIDYALAQGKRCYLPVLDPLNTSGTLIFMEYFAGDQLIANKHGIMEPKWGIDQQSRKTISANELDLVLLPILAFDDEGHRLGQGAGHYDRTFAFLKMREQKTDIVKKPFLLGLGYEAQHLETIPFDEWDINLDAVVTEKGILIISPEWGMK